MTYFVPGMCIVCAELSSNVSCLTKIWACTCLKWDNASRWVFSGFESVFQEDLLSCWPFRERFAITDGHFWILKKDGIPGHWGTQPVGLDEQGIANRFEESYFNHAVSFVHLCPSPWALTADFCADKGIILIEQVCR